MERKQDLIPHLYSYNYHSVSRFTPAIQNHYFKLRCKPCENSCQHIMSALLSIEPFCTIDEQTDGFGNRVQYGSYNTPHDQFAFSSTGSVLCYPYRIADDKPHPIYRFPTSLTTATAEMRQFVVDVKASMASSTPLDIASALMHAIYDTLVYEPGSTDERTTAAMVFTSRRGVCQDFAHLLIALCRTAGLMARYVNGLLVGEGKTHAWVEVYDDGAWFGLDPTHNCEIVYDYLKIAHGRDVNDCPSNRGRILYTLTHEETEISAVVIKK